MRTTIENGNLLFYRHWAILRLYQQACILLSLVDGQCRHGVHITAEFSKRFQLPVLCLVNLQCTCHLLHSLDLGITTHTAHRDTYVNGRTVTLVEEVRIEEYLPVSD